MKRHIRLSWWPAAALLALVAACDGGSPPPSPPPPPPLVDGGTSVCSRPAEGCPCADGTDPLECYQEAHIEGGIAYCQAGARYCRDGAWGACENLRDFNISLSNKLLQDPTTCSVCNPDCQIGSATPMTADLTPTNSSDVVYDAPRGGLTLTPTSTSTGVMTPDTDGDGYVDTADGCAGTVGWNAASCDGNATNDGFYHTLPFGSTPVTDAVSLTVRMDQADVYLLVDGTDSMGGEISNLQSTLTTGTFDATCASAANTGVIGAIKCAIANPAFGLGHFREYATGGGSEAGVDTNLVYHHDLDPTTTDASMTTSVGRLYTTSNVTTQESITQAIYSTLTGRGLGRFIPNRLACANGGSGYACFRPGSIPIVVLITDAMFANGSVSTWNYTDAHDATWPGAMMPGLRAVDTAAAETQATAYALGDMLNGYISMSGATRGMTDDVSSGCFSSGAPDAVFSFTISGSASRRIAIDSRSSEYDTVLGLRDSSFTSLGCNDDVSDIGGTLHSRVVQTLAPGTYYVVVDGWSSESGDYTLQIRDLSQFTTRSGETQATAYDLGALGTSALTAIGSTTDMANDVTLSCGSTGTPDAVFRFTVGSTQNVAIHTRGSNFDTAVSLRDSTFTTEVGCNGDSTFTSLENDISRLYATLSAGTYYVVVDAQTDEGENPSNGEFVLNIEPTPGTPPNPRVGDTQATAIDLGTINSSAIRTSGINTLYSDDYTLSCGNAGGADVVYRFTLSATQVVLVDTSGSFYDTAVSIRDSSFAEVTSGCDDDTGVNVDASSRLSRTLAAGTYYIVVDAKTGTASGSTGAFNLLVSAASTTPTTPKNVVIADDYGDVDLGVITTLRTIDGTTTGLSSNERPCGVTTGSSVGPDAIFSFTTGSATGTYTFSTEGSSFDTNISVMRAGTGSNHVTVVCNDNDSSLVNTSNSYLSISTLAANTTYWVVVDSNSNTTSGAYRLRISPPSATTTYDAFLGETVNDPSYDLGDVTTTGRNITFPSTGLRSEFTLGTGCQGASEGANAEALFKFTLTSPRTLLINTAGSTGGADTQLAIYSGPPTGTNQAVCSDAASSTTETLTTAMLGAGTYYLVVQGDVTTFSLNLVPEVPPTSSASSTGLTADSTVPWSTVSSTLASSSAKFATISTCTASTDCADVLTAANAVGVSSGSIDASGNPFVYSAASDGSNLGQTIATAVKNVANNVRLDGNVVCTDISPTNGIDECSLVTSILPNPSCGTGCTGASGSVCTNCQAGTTINYIVTMANNVFAATAVDQVFDFAIDAMAGGVLQTRTAARVLVPAGSMSTYTSTGSFWLTYDSSDRCTTPPQRPDWQTFTYSADVPAGTSLFFDVYTADSIQGLGSVSPVTIAGVTGTNVALDLGDSFVAGGQTNFRVFTKVLARLVANAGATSSPVFRSWTIQYTCTDFE